MLALKIESFQNFDTIFTILAKKLYIQKVDKNENIGERSICNFSTIFWGGRVVAQERGEILPKVSPKFRQNFAKRL